VVLAAVMASVNEGKVAVALLPAAVVFSVVGGGLGVVSVAAAGGLAAGSVAVVLSTVMFDSCLSCLAATGEAQRHSRMLAAMHSEIARMIAGRGFQLRPARKCTAARRLMCCRCDGHRIART
jgi:hypothetical protein